MGEPQRPIHSPIGASNMYRWEACPGSVALCVMMPEYEDEDEAFSRYEGDGRKAHTLAALAVDGELWVAPNKDMSDAIHTYVEVCREYFTASHRALGAQRWIEQRLDASDKVPGMYGTVDCLIYWPWLKKLIVIDFKYGAGVYVAAQGNTQLLYYAVAAIKSDLVPEVECAELVIVQPRIPSDGDGGIRRAEVTSDELRDFEVRVRTATNAVFEPHAPLRSGDHCRFCPAAAVCPELGHKRDTALMSDFAEPLQPKATYSPETIAKALDSLDPLKAYIKAVDELAYRELNAGRSIPGYKLVAKRPTRRISEPNTVVSLLSRNDPSVYMTQSELKSPAQLEKALTKEDRVLIAPYIVSESSGSVVVPESDPRPAVGGRNATADFLTLRALGVED